MNNFAHLKDRSGRVSAADVGRQVGCRDWPLGMCHSETGRRSRESSRTR